MTGMTQEIQDALFNIDEVTEMRHAIYNDEDDDYESVDWYDKKHTAINETCVAMDLEDIKKIVNNYGVVEIMEKLNDEYGDDFITDFMTKDRVLKYQTLMYHILEEFITLITTDNDDSDDSDDSDYDTDTLSSADTEDSDD
jgi:hypothetical protein